MLQSQEIDVKKEATKEKITLMFLRIVRKLNYIATSVLSTNKIDAVSANYIEILSDIDTAELLTIKSLRSVRDTYRKLRFKLDKESVELCSVAILIAEFIETYGEDADYKVVEENKAADVKVTKNLEVASN